MSLDMFLKIDTVKGESTDDKHKDEIDVLAWSWGLSQPAAPIGGGSGAGKVSVQGLSLTKYIDKSSPTLMLSTCNGKHFKQAMLTVRKPGTRALEYFKITMKDVLVSSVSMGGSAGEDRLTENITLNFSSFKEEYTPQKPDGSGEAVVSAGWDIKKNAAL